MLPDSIKQFFSKGDARSIVVKRNVAGTLLVKVLSIIVQLLLVPLTLGYLDSDIYGIWLVASSVIAWFGFFDIGLSPGLKNRLAEAIAKEDYKRGRELVSTACMLMCAIFIPLGIIACILIPHINWSTCFNVAQHLNHQLVEVMMVLFCCFALQMIFSIVTAVAQGLQKTALAALFPVAGNIVALMVIWILRQINSQGSMLSLALSISFIPVLTNIVGGVILFKSKTGRLISPSVKYLRKDTVRDLMGLGVKFFLIQLQVVVLYQSANILIANIEGSVAVTEYNIAYRYIFCGAMVFQVFLVPFWPAFTDAYAAGDYQWMQRSYRKLVKTFLFMSACVIAMVTLSPLVYHLWIGSSVTVPFGMTVAVALFSICSGWVQMQTHLINGIGDIRLQTIVCSVGMLAQIPLSLLLGRCFGFGAEGVVYSMTFITVAYGLIFGLQLRQLLKLNTITLFK